MRIQNLFKQLCAKMALLLVSVVCAGLTGCQTFHGGMYSGPRLGPIAGPARAGVNPFGNFPGPAGQCCHDVDLCQIQGRRQPSMQFRSGNWPAASNYHSHHDPHVVQSLKGKCQCANCRQNRRQKTVRSRHGVCHDPCCNTCQSGYASCGEGCQTSATCHGASSDCPTCHGTSPHGVPPSVPPMDENWQNESYDEDPGAPRTFEHEDPPAPPEEEETPPPAARVFAPPAGVTQTGYFDPVTGTVQPSPGSHPLPAVPGEMVIKRRIQ